MLEPKAETFEVTELGEVCVGSNHWAIFEDAVSELLELKSAIEAKASSKTTEHLAVKVTLLFCKAPWL